MKLLEVDKSKCDGDGLCIKECPVAIIRLDIEDKYPCIDLSDEMFCLNCGHCVAICPKKALNHAKVPFQDFAPIIKELKIDHPEAVQFLRSRRSIRFYKDEPVDEGKIQQLLAIARYAPTASNSQLVEYIVINDKQKIKQLAKRTIDWISDALREDTQNRWPGYMSRFAAAWEKGSDPVLRNAPVLLLATAPQEAAHGMIDIAIALSYIELIAPTLGLGSCLAGLLQRGLLQCPSLKEAAGLQQGYPHHFPLMLGYPKFKYQRLPERKMPKITWR